MVVIPGKAGAVRVSPDDSRHGDPCVACGEAGPNGRYMERVDGIRVMLCRDFISCNRRTGATKYVRND